MSIAVRGENETVGQFSSSTEREEIVGREGLVRREEL